MRQRACQIAGHRRRHDVVSESLPDRHRCAYVLEPDILWSREKRQLVSNTKPALTQRLHRAIEHHLAVTEIGKYVAIG